MRTRSLQLAWEHDGHKLAYAPTRGKDELYYLTVKGENVEQCFSMKPSRLLSLKEMIERALADVATESEGHTE